MPEKKWLSFFDFFSHRNRITDLIGNYKVEYNPKKVRSFSIAFFLFESVSNFLVGLTIEKHPIGANIFMGLFLGAVVVYGFVVLVFCKER